MEKIELSNGVKMPAMNFGVYRITDPAECEAAVLSALKAGWRGIDTAASYLNERAVGRAVARSGIPRSELFITTKLWVQEASEAGAERAIRRSLELLGTDTIDLYLIHQPYGDIYGAWRTMERFYEAGVLKAIGVSNFQPDRITDFALNQRIRPMVNQIEVNPFCQQREADAVNRALGVMPSAWAPFAEGRDGLLENPVLREIAADRGGQHAFTNKADVRRFMAGAAAGDHRHVVFIQIATDHHPDRRVALQTGEVIPRAGDNGTLNHIVDEAGALVKKELRHSGS